MSTPGIEYFLPLVVLALIATLVAFGGIVAGLITTGVGFRISGFATSVGVLCEIGKFISCEKNADSLIMTSAILLPPVIFGAMGMLIGSFRSDSGAAPPGPPGRR